MNKTKITLTAAVLALSTAAQAQQPAEQNANYHEVRIFASLVLIPWFAEPTSSPHRYLMEASE